MRCSNRCTDSILCGSIRECHCESQSLSQQTRLTFTVIKMLLISSLRQLPLSHAVLRLLFRGRGFVITFTPSSDISSDKRKRFNHAASEL